MDSCAMAEMLRDELERLKTTDKCARCFSFSRSNENVIHSCAQRRRNASTSRLFFALIGTTQPVSFLLLSPALFIQHGRLRQRRRGWQAHVSPAQGQVYHCDDSASQGTENQEGVVRASCTFLFFLFLIFLLSVISSAPALLVTRFIRTLKEPLVLHRFV